MKSMVRMLRNSHCLSSPRKRDGGVELTQSYKEPLEVGVDIGDKQMGKLVEASEYRKHIYPRKILTENSLKL